jgi:hypothetical protein
MTLSPAEHVQTYPRVAAARPRPAEGVRMAGAARARVLVIAGAVAIFLLSLYPRAINLGGYLTTDEANWMGRTALFAQALAEGDPAGTYQSGHPGVMTMWASLVGMGPERALGLAPHVRPDGVEKAPGYLETLRLARRSFAVLTALTVVAVALLTWRLFGAGPGLLAGVLLGLEPFFLAHSVVAHVDSNLASWMTISLLSGLVYFRAGGGRGYLALSGVAAGLAFLSKAPSAFLPLFIPIVALTAVVRRRGGFGRLVVDGLVWGLPALAVAMLLWSSFRSDPLGTLRLMADYTEAVGGAEHDNFFLGRPAGDPGPLYYPLTLGFRLTPVTMLGLALLLLGLAPIGRRVPTAWLPRIGLLGAYTVLFIGMMTLAPKKFDRYLLPIFPTLEVLAAIGLWLAVRRLPRGVGRRALPLILLVVGMAQALPAALVYPYYLSYYNPLLGGGPGARRSIVVGWGEGLDIVTEYLNAKPDAEHLTLAGFYPRVIRAQFKGSILSDKEYDAAVADYIVMYVNALQRDLTDRLRTVTRGARPEMVVRINGIEYVRLYAVPPPSRSSAAGTEFDGAVRLQRTYLRSDERPYLKSDDLNPGDTLELTLRWMVTRPVDQDLTAVVRLLDKSGSLVDEHAVPVGVGAGSRTSTMRPNGVGIETHRMTLPDAPNRYDLAVGLRRPNGEWLPITSWPERLAPQFRRAPDQVIVESIDAE